MSEQVIDGINHLLRMTSASANFNRQDMLSALLGFRAAVLAGLPWPCPPGMDTDEYEQRLREEIGQ